MLEGLNLVTFKDTSEIVSDFSRAGLGISDDFRLAARLSQLFFYTNSFFHRYPVLDLCAPPSEAIGRFDFVVCSDVLEHIPAPVDRALDGLRSLLKPDGFAVVSVPTRPVLEESGLCRGGLPEVDQTIEYYADLVDWNIEDGYLTWRDISGQLHIDEKPEIHGGQGATVAFRLWSVSDLARRLHNAGFTSVSAPAWLPDFASGPVDMTYSGLVIARA